MLLFRSVCSSHTSLPSEPILGSHSLDSEIVEFGETPLGSFHSHHMAAGSLDPDTLWANGPSVAMAVIHQTAPADQYAVRARA